MTRKRSQWFRLFVPVGFALVGLKAAAFPPEEPNLAIGFVWPVLGTYTTLPSRNVESPIVPHQSPLCRPGKWNTDQNGFGGDYNPGHCDLLHHYHPGEDWNSCSGGEAETPVYSIGNGVVVEVDTVRAGDNEEDGYYITIEHTLPRAESPSDYLLTDTVSNEGDFSVLYSTYEHINRPDLAQGDIVKKGQMIGTIASTNQTHLHLELKTQGFGVINCSQCGYCTSHQDIIDNHFLWPTQFIADHTDDIYGAPVGNLGDVEIFSEQPLFGESEGTIEFCAGTPGEESCASRFAEISDWQEERVRFNIFSDGFTDQDFNVPVTIEVTRSEEAGPQALTRFTYPFVDVGSAWYGESVVSLWKRDVVEDRGSGQFWPEAEVTRAEFVSMLVKAQNVQCEVVDCAREPLYTDVSQADLPYVRAAYNQEWIGLNNETEFRPAERLNRAEAAVLLSRAFDLPTDNEGCLNLADVQDPGEWFYDAVCAASRLGIIQGYPSGRECGRPTDERSHFCPGGTLIKAEAAKMIYASGRVQIPGMVEP